jgi:hypothetical protein
MIRLSDCVAGSAVVLASPSAGQTKCQLSASVVLESCHQRATLHWQQALDVLLQVAAAAACSAFSSCAAAAAVGPAADAAVAAAAASADHDDDDRRGCRESGTI